MVMMLLDIGPPGGVIGLGVGVGFLFIAFAVAFVAYRLLRRTVKMALRLAIVATILMIGFAGTLAFFYMGSGNSPKGRPSPTRQR
jgi:hypothetical protein